MHVRFDNQYGFGRRTFTLTRDYQCKALDVELKTGTWSDGASNPRRFILFAYMLLLLCFKWSMLEFLILSYFVALTQLMPATGWFLKAFVYHDYLYHQQAGKLKSDWYFLVAMLDITFNAHRSGWRGWFDIIFGVQVAFIYFIGVVFAGWFAYRGHANK